MNQEKKPSVAFLTLGCKVNAYETDAMETLFQKAGYDIKEFTEKAEIYIINTCTVTNIADRKSRQMLHKAKRKNPDAVIVAAGCYVQSAKEQLAIDDKVDLVVGNNQKKEIVNIVESFLSDRIKRTVVKEISGEKEYEELKAETIGEKTRAYIKIQDGCNQFCSYCIIPYTRGRVRSRDQKQIIEEIRNLAERGYKEVVLTGIHLSSYGVDLSHDKEIDREPLLTVIRKISEIEGIERIRLGSLEPRIITEKFTKELSEYKKICPHFHLSLQSGCNDTLARMNRKYTTEEYEKCCHILRNYFENPAITTDVIVGFPGETEEEFIQTVSFLEKIRFAQMHIFKYSRRKGTRAEKMLDQVDENIKNKRSSILLDLNLKFREEYKKTFYGRNEKILVEEKVSLDDKDFFTGHNERYLKLAVPAGNEDLTGQVITAEVTEHEKGDLAFCKIID